MNLHPKLTTKGLFHIREHPWVLGQATGNLDYLTHHGPDSGEATTFPPYSIFCSSPSRLHPNGLFFQDSQVGVPKLSRVGVSGLLTATAPHPELKSGRALNQSCSSRPELSNAMLHSLRRRREEVDSRLLVVGSQTGSLTPGPSLPITCAADVQMGNARPFWTSTLQEFSIVIKNASRRGDLTPQIVF